MPKVTPEPAAATAMNPLLAVLEAKHEEFTAKKKALDNAVALNKQTLDTLSKELDLHCSKFITTRSVKPCEDVVDSDTKTTCGHVLTFTGHKKGKLPKDGLGGYIRLELDGSVTLGINTKTWSFLKLDSKELISIIAAEVYPVEKIRAV